MDDVVERIQGKRRVDAHLVRVMHKQYRRGASIGDLAKKYKMSKSTVYMAFKRYDRHIRPRSDEEYTEEEIRSFYQFYQVCGSLEQTSKKFNIRVPVLRWQFDKYKLPSVRTFIRRTQAYTDQEIKKIHRYYLKHGYKATSEKFDIALGTLYTAFKRRGLATSRTSEAAASEE